MITLTTKGDLHKTKNFFKSCLNRDYLKVLHQYGRKGVDALAKATPKDTGKTAASWKYEIKEQQGKTSIIFTNTNIQNGVPVAIVLQYGHGTRGGGWVQGRDYINPAIQPIFDEIAESAWKEVKASWR